MTDRDCPVCVRWKDRGGRVREEYERCVPMEGELPYIEIVQTHHHPDCPMVKPVPGLKGATHGAPA